MRILIDIDAKDFGRQLQAARETAGLTLAAAGQLAGMTGTNFLKLERGEHKSVPLSTIARAAYAVKLNLAPYLIQWEAEAQAAIRKIDQSPS